MPETLVRSGTGVESICKLREHVEVALFWLFLSSSAAVPLILLFRHGAD
jgi:hypothetical protein